MSDDSNQSEQPASLSESINWDDVDIMFRATEREEEDLRSILLRVATMGPEYTRPLVQCLTRRLCKAGVLSPARHDKHSKTRILEALSDLKMILDEKAEQEECPF
jgi:hypothetical protein